MIPFFGCIFKYGLVFGKRLEAIFGEETGANHVIVCNRVFAVPYSPIMGVSVRIPIGCSGLRLLVLISIERRGRPVKAGRVIGFNHLGQDYKILVGELFPKFIGNPLTHCFIFSFPSPAEPSGLVFIISAPEGDARVISQSFHVFNRFLTNIFQQGAFRRIEAASEHEVLPYQDAVLIAKIIE